VFEYKRDEERYQRRYQRRFRVVDGKEFLRCFLVDRK
jgi:hypothetical protein